MKKNLLALTFLCGLGFSAHAQKWVLQNTTNPETPPQYFSTQMHVVSDQVAWQLLQEGATGATTNTFSKTSNGGTNWTFGSVNGAANYQAAGVHAIDGNTAYVAQFGGSGGGEVVKTTNGGNTWTKSTTAAQFPAAAGGFANWVYFFDANNGVTLGDPTNGSFEIYTTSNAGATWTRVPAANLPAPLDGGEYGLVGSYTAIGNTIWAGTTHLAGGDPNAPLPARILKSTDRGLTWTASPVIPALSGYISKVAMTDANNGIAVNGLTIVATTNGGSTWTPVTYTGNYNRFDVTNVPGTNILVSVGPSVAGTVTSATQYGSSYSTNNGATWIDIDRGVYRSSVDFSSRTAGYAGAQTDDNGAGGVYKASATILGVSRNSELQQALSVYPNPSSNGVFQLQLQSGIKAGTSVRVFDALGRQVLNQQLNATAIASQVASVDLSKEKAGLYTLELRTENGVAQQKLVIE
ncbi:T9SS type A sorting domain-containing protein [Hymenobacter aquaticus]|uniref:T9SS type A sorting domain-containing protein n=1 Tax=Hymenobacter aquaticus TaxID=1867101 RepID=A0A4Z0Q3V6_9BACT|nr:T9SS type A sorting domain-containing protein [Hymenobacter aquaticus]TGE24758.1 T9SS type A sorting domain-containing protein [Hymenobacter aquaticus]